MCLSGSVGVSDKHVTCLTCELDEERCQYVDATFSPSTDFYVLSCMGPGVPYFSLRSPHELTERQWPLTLSPFDPLTPDPPPKGGRGFLVSPPVWISGLSV